MLETGDIVTTSVSDYPNYYIYLGKFGSKARLLIPDVPNVMFVVSLDKVKRITK